MVRVQSIVGALGVGLAIGGLGICSTLTKNVTTTLHATGRSVSRRSICALNEVRGRRGLLS
jgi:hypothetical protein